MKVNYLTELPLLVGHTEGLFFEPETLGEKEILKFFSERMENMNYDPDKRR